MTSDHNLTCGELADRIRPFMRKHVTALVAVCAGLAAWLLVTGQPGGLAFILIAAGSLLPIYAWNAHTETSLPLGPLIGLQSLIIYGTPVIAQNRSVFAYSSDEVLRAAMEVLLFSASLTAMWLLMFRNSGQRRPATYLKFKFLNSEHPGQLVSFGMTLLAMSVGYHVANMAGWLEFIPSGLYPVARTVGDAIGIGGGLLCGYFMGLGELRGIRSLIVWILFVIHCIFTSSNYTLFPVTALIIAISIGIFLGRGRVPLLLLVVVSTVIGFFNLSKFEMRSAYWIEGSAYAPQELSILPERYREWATRCWGHLTASEEFKSDRERITSQRIADRINNLVNLLDVQSYVTRDHVPVLNGETYTIIPALLIPRIFWPEKPRTHEGMVLLNVHFGKQTREESFVTYISWGLLPEAYGNFGPVWGALFCGGIMGLIIGWMESWSRYYPLISLQALIFLSLLVQFGSSFEMVASLWVTSIFQMLTAVVVGTIAFVEKASFPTDDT